jgi:phosphoribosylaminoimidazole-succinocarboxamide synthase
MGQHDEAITFNDVINLVGAETATLLRDSTLELYQRGAALAAANGILMADTKFEFGRDQQGNLLLGDEIFTSDSSRYWPADEWQPGRVQRSFDKQIVRDWASGTGWDKTAPGPAVPAEIVELTRSRYVELYQRITGQTWA